MKVPNEDKKYYKAAFNIINGNPHVSYADELGNNSSINLKFLENVVALIHQANQVGVKTLNKYKQSGESPSLNLYSSKIGNEKLNKTSKQEKKRQQERKELDKLFADLTKDLQKLTKEPKKKLEKSPIEKNN
jgi:predicted RNA-binding protein with RPS1 domain